MTQSGRGDIDIMSLLELLSITRHRVVITTCSPYFLYSIIILLKDNLAVSYFKLHLFNLKKAMELISVCNLLSAFYLLN